MKQENFRLCRDPETLRLGSYGALEFLTCRDL
jgi:hypothetical protein